MRIVRNALGGILLFLYGFRVAVLILYEAQYPVLCVKILLMISGVLVAAGLTIWIAFFIFEQIKGKKTHEKED